MPKKFYFLMVFILFILGCSKTNDTTIDTSSKTSYTLIDTNLNLDIEGYSTTCTRPSIDEPVIYIKENGDWKLVNTNLPGKGQYYLDGKYYGYGMCDVVVCNKISKPVAVNLIEYQKIGEKEGQDSGGYMVPVYESVELKGEIKVEFEYFSDSSCKSKKTFSEIILK